MCSSNETANVIPLAANPRDPWHHKDSEPRLGLSRACMVELDPHRESQAVRQFCNGLEHQGLRNGGAAAGIPPVLTVEGISLEKRQGSQEFHATKQGKGSSGTGAQNIWM